jgi:Flp pilus assembly protein TadG
VLVDATDEMSCAPCPTELLRRFRQDESGSTAIMFALSLVPVVFAAGAALDYSRADNLRTKLQAATDGTLLNLCQANASLTQAQLQEKALKSVQSYLPNAGVTIDSLVVTNDPRQITLTTRANYETTFAKITGITEFPLTVRGSCSAEERLFEIALALDTTGSMAISDGTMSKIEALRKAATSFVDFVFTTGTMKDHSKVSLVPFAAAVAVNPSGYRTATWIDQEGKSSLHSRSWRCHTPRTPPGEIE